MRELSNPQSRQEVEMGLHPKVMQVIQSRKVWAGLIGLITTGTLWWLGEIEGARAVEALTWVLGIFIGSVALEDGMTRLFSSLAHAVAANDLAAERGDSQKEERENEDDAW